MGFESPANGSLASGLTLQGDGSPTARQRITFSKSLASAGGIIDYKENLFAATYDPSLYFGINQDANGNLVTAGQPGLSWGFEGDYDDGSGTHKMEVYLQYLNATDTVTIRPIFLQLNRDTGATTGFSLVGNDIRLNTQANATVIQTNASAINLFPNTGTAHTASTKSVALYSDGVNGTALYLGFAAAIDALRFDTQGATIASANIGGAVALRLYKLSGASAVAVSIGGVNDNGQVLLVDGLNRGDANAPIIIARGQTVQNVDIVQVQTQGGAVYGGFNKDGYFFTKKNTAPADADLVAGQLALWFDATNGLAKLMVKAKQADGTVKTASVALA